MARIDILSPTEIQITAALEDAVSMIQDAAEHLEQFAQEVMTIHDRMPEFDYTYFCFYAYDTAALFERMLGVDPKQYLSFSLNAPNAFFYTLYGGMCGLYDMARNELNNKPKLAAEPERGENNDYT